MPTHAPPQPDWPLYVTAFLNRNPDLTTAASAGRAIVAHAKPVFGGITAMHLETLAHRLFAERELESRRAAAEWLSDHQQGVTVDEERRAEFAAEVEWGCA